MRVDEFINAMYASIEANSLANLLDSGERQARYIAEVWNDFRLPDDPEMTVCNE